MNTEEEVITRLEAIEQRLSMLIHPCNGLKENLQEQIIYYQGKVIEAMLKANPSTRNAMADAIEFGGVK